MSSLTCVGGVATTSYLLKSSMQLPVRVCILVHIPCFITRHLVPCLLCAVFHGVLGRRFGEDEAAPLFKVNW
jgi:hypothetical protein